MFSVLAASFLCVTTVADARFDATPMSDRLATSACSLDEMDPRSLADLSLLQMRANAHDAKSQALKNVPTSLARTGCATEVPRPSRTLLLTLVQAGHGSTALSQVLMSSSKLSTLCPGKGWQCEGIDLWKKHVSKSVADDGDANRLMETLTGVWDLERPVLLDKLFPDEQNYSALVRKAVSNANFEVTSAFAKYDITELVPAHIVMWTPFCVRRLSKKLIFSRVNKTGMADVDAEVYSLEELQRQHASLVSKGEPVIVISLADLIWRPDETLADLQRFLPCLGKLSSDFVPVLGKDVFRGNKFKVHGSVKSYGAANDPQKCCRFDLATHTCEDDAHYNALGEFSEKLKKLEEYFKNYTRVY